MSCGYLPQSYIFPRPFDGEDPTLIQTTCIISSFWRRQCNLSKAPGKIQFTSIQN